jgi:beta-N-acetylhexosaminidase
MKPLILGLSGTSLTPDELALFRAIEPAGYILFAHNIADRAQIRALTDSLRALGVGEALPILIDQEGGRVARLKPPEWPAFPAGDSFAALYANAPMSAIEAARVNGLALGLMLAEVGITVNCAPVLDVRHTETHDAIGDRALGGEPGQVAALGQAMLDGMGAGGVVGVVKHMPGQGRSVVDSHHALPVVSADAETLGADLAPFRALSNVLIAMTGHVVFNAWDAERCATLSPIVIGDIIRGQIGFDGLLLSDDLHMEALIGSIAERAVAAIAAGCDLALACWARGDDVRAVADALPDISAASRARLDRAMSSIGTAPPKSVDRIPSLIAKRDALLAYAV